MRAEARLETWRASNALRDSLWTWVDEGGGMLGRELGSPEFFGEEYLAHNKPDPTGWAAALAHAAGDAEFAQYDYGFGLADLGPSDARWAPSTPGGGAPGLASGAVREAQQREGIARRPGVDSSVEFANSFAT